MPAVAPALLAAAKHFPYLLTLVLAAVHVASASRSGPAARLLALVRSISECTALRSEEHRAKWEHVRLEQARAIMRFCAPVFSFALLARVVRFYSLDADSQGHVSETAMCAGVATYALAVVVGTWPALLTVRRVDTLHNVLMLVVMVRLGFSRADPSFFSMRGLNMFVRMLLAACQMDIRKTFAWNSLLSVITCFALPKNVGVFADAFMPSVPMLVVLEWLVCAATMWLAYAIECQLKAQLQTNVELEDLRQAMLRILGAVCDVMLKLDGDLRIRQPSPQLLSLLLGRSVDAEALEGRDFTLFLPLSEQAALRGFLEAAADRRGAAAALNIQLYGADGCAMHMQLFHASMSSSGRPLHLLGLRHIAGEGPAFQDSEAGGGEASWEAEAAALEDEAPAPGPEPEAGARAAEARAPEAEAPAPGPEPEPELGARAAICFDAGTERLSILHASPVFGAEGPAELLDWMPAAVARVFDLWVEREVRAAPTDRRSVSGNLRWPLALRTPAGGQRELHAKEAWLEIEPLDECDEEDGMPVTLVLEGLRSLPLAEEVCHGTQEPFPQEACRKRTLGQSWHGVREDYDGDAASSASSSNICPADSVSCIGAQRLLALGGARLRMARR